LVAINLPLIFYEFDLCGAREKSGAGKTSREHTQSRADCKDRAPNISGLTRARRKALSSH
jgi:hypothetical protein